MEERTDPRIEKYILGHLTGTELERFEAEMLADVSLAEAVREHRTAWEIGEILMEEKLRSKIRKRFSAPPPAPTFGSTFFKKWKFALAAMLLLGIAFFFIFKNGQNERPVPVKNLPAPEVLPEKTPTETAPPLIETPKNDPEPKPKNPIADTQKQPALRTLAVANYRVPAGLSGVRGAKDGDNLSLATKAFFEKKYARTLDLLKILPENDRQDALSLRAHAHFLTGKFEAAARDFSDLEKGGIYLSEAQWFGLLARMAADRTDKKALQAELEAIRQTADHPYQKAAEAMKF